MRDNGCIPSGIQLQTAAVELGGSGPEASGPTWRLSHFEARQHTRRGRAEREREASGAEADGVDVERGEADAMLPGE